MKEYKEDEYEVQVFNSMSEVADHILSTEDIEDYELTKSRTLSRDFYGKPKSFKNLIDWLRYGQETQTEAFIDNLKDAGTSIDVNDGIFRDIEGFAYDMGSVVKGEPECCLNTGAPSPRPSLSIFIDTGYCGGVEAETINYRGFAIVKLINTLIAKGYLLDIHFVHYITTGGGCSKSYCAHLFKVNTDFLALSTIGFASTCTFFRCITWLLTAIQNCNKDYEGDGCSRPSSDVIKKLKKKGLFIPSGYTDGFFESCSKEDAEKRIVEIFNKWAEKNHSEKLSTL